MKVESPHLENMIYIAETFSEADLADIESFLISFEQVLRHQLFLWEN